MQINTSCATTSLQRLVVLTGLQNTDGLNGRVAVTPTNAEKMLIGKFNSGALESEDMFMELPKNPTTEDLAKPTLRWEETPGEQQTFDLVFESHDFDHGNGYTVFIE